MICGAVLTGGRSSRFGRDKCRETFRGKRLVEIAFEKLASVVDEVYVVGKDYGIGKHVEDVFEYLGPLNALYSFFTKVSEAGGVMVLPCDMPLVPVELLEFVRDVSGDYDIVVPQYKGFFEPLVGYYRRTTLPMIKSLIDHQNLAMKNLILSPDFRVRIINESELKKFGNPSRFFLNINYPEDMERI